MIEWGVIGFGIVVLVGGIFVLSRWERRETVAMIEEFAERFPGRCILCSYHAYGVREGHTVASLPPHDCIEGNGSERQEVVPGVPTERVHDS